jgi:glycerate 2-kinase
LAILDRALATVDGDAAVQRALSRDGSCLNLGGLRIPVSGEVHLLAVGKAAVPMARAALRLVPVASGLIVTHRVGKESWDSRVRIMTSSHPLPDTSSLEAAREALALADRLRSEDLFLVLLSGGTSALLEESCLPLEDLRRCYAGLLRSGLDIRAQNEVRKGLSNVKGGRLAERAVARGARSVSLILSDIVGDPIEDIGSGPTAPSSSRGKGARTILQRSGLWETMPAEVRSTLDKVHEGPSRWQDSTGRVHAFIVANNEQACRAGTTEAEARQYRARFLPTRIQGEAREAGLRFVAQALAWDDGSARRALIAGGETTVTVRGNGRGGRNQELALSAVEVLQGKAAVLLSCGTDGIDGNTKAAGAIVDGLSYRRARQMGLDPIEYLERNDSHAFFQALEDLIITGSTGTNVADIQILLEDRRADVDAHSR